MKKKEILLIVFLVCVDQFSKFLVEKYVSYFCLIPHFLEIVFMKNTGAAWSILDGGRWFFVLLSFAFLFFLTFMRRRFLIGKWTMLSYSFLYAGILGNLIDRLFFGYVRDFFSFQFGNYFFPVFNFADIFIVMGAIFLFLITYGGDKDETHCRTRRKHETR